MTELSLKHLFAAKSLIRVALVNSFLSCIYAWQAILRFAEILWEPSIHGLFLCKNRTLEDYEQRFYDDEARDELEMEKMALDSMIIAILASSKFKSQKAAPKNKWLSKLVAMKIIFYLCNDWIN